MTSDFLIGAIRASRDLHPLVKTELEEILDRAEPAEPRKVTKRDRILGRKLTYDSCGYCGKILYPKPIYCPECGKPVKWS